MKKVIKSFLALSMAAFALASCEDVPAPYEIPGSADNGGDTELPEGVYLDQSFTSSLGDFKSIGNNENIAWEIDYSSACITGYKDYGSGSKSNQAGVTYLVSPEIDLTNAKEAYVEMTYALNYERADINTNNALLISKDYDDDPTKATWVAIPYSTEGVNSSFDFVDVASNIPADFIGDKVRLALRHTCTASQSSTWEVKSLAVKEGKTEDVNPGGTPGGTPGTVDGNTITVNAADFGLDNGTALGTLTLSDGTTLTFASGGNNNAPKYYKTGTNFRMYPKNTMTVKATKTIASITIHCDNFNGTIYNASGDITADPGTLATDNAVISITGINNATTTITNVSQNTKAASQLRIVSMSITYAQ